MPTQPQKLNKKGKDSNDDSSKYESGSYVHFGHNIELARPNKALRTKKIAFKKSKKPGKLGKTKTKLPRKQLLSVIKKAMDLAISPAEKPQKAYKQVESPNYPNLPLWSISSKKANKKMLCSFYIMSSNIETIIFICAVR